jgi:class 3 adenylate cyclase
MTQAHVRYAWNHEIALAYQVVGAGPMDLLYMQSNISNVEVNWENPALASFLRELSGFGRLIVADRRGLGCSERFTPEGVPPIDRFLGTVRAEEADLDRVLATVLFTDIVDSTAKAAELGDRRWQELVASHDSVVRALLSRFRGKEVDTAGDGFFVVFDGPARAVRCAQAITEAVRPLGLEVRAGVHTGEVDATGAAVRGIAVNIGARIGARAGASEVLVSQTVKDLVAGSGLSFEDRGEHELKGVPDRWRLFVVAD